MIYKILFYSKDKGGLFVRFFINERMLKKIVISLLLILSFQFLVNMPVHASGDDNVLLGPVLDLFTRLGDGIMNIMQKTFMNMGASGVWVNTSTNTWLKILIAVIAITLAIVATVAIIYTGGSALTIVYTALGAVVKTLGVGAVAYFAVTEAHFLESRFFSTRI